VKDCGSDRGESVKSAAGPLPAGSEAPPASFMCVADSTPTVLAFASGTLSRVGRARKVPERARRSPEIRLLGATRPASHPAFTISSRK
jgi:hypothetical protein